MANVVLTGAEQEGLPAIVAALVEAGAAEPPGARLLDRMRGTVAIVVPDADVAVTLRFREGSCYVEAGAASRVDVRLTMPSATLLGLPSIPLVCGVPSLRHPDGRAFARAALLRRVRVAGVRHVALLTQLTRLLSVA